MPFNNDWAEAIKEMVIRPVCEELGLELKRADDWSSSTAIIDDIVKAIREADVVIADISESNPNVFYELGYAHAIKPRRTILITSEPPENSPFDVRHYRIFKYSVKEPEREHFRKKLKEAIENALKASVYSANLDNRYPDLKFCFNNGDTVKNIAINRPMDQLDQLERYYELRFRVINEGTAPANDVQVFIYFPEEVQVVSRYFLEPSSAIVTPPLMSNIVVSEEENQAIFEVGKLGHGLRYDSDVAYVKFKAGEPHDFSIKYAIYCDELPEHIEGNLEVHFQG